ncbi:hypothetical protein QNN00_10000 [Bacillus velezensis]|nr:hypothetical protein [Bacillus velezensis]
MLSEEEFVPPKAGQETEKEPVFTTSGITKQTNDRPEQFAKQETEEIPAVKKRSFTPRLRMQKSKCLRSRTARLKSGAHGKRGVCRLYRRTRA